MKTLYLECGMGASGDMLTAALLELLDEPEKFIEIMNGAFVNYGGGICISAERKQTCGIFGTHINVAVHGAFEGHNSDAHSEDSHHSHHRSLGDVIRIIESLELPCSVRQSAAEVYRLIAEAESAVHGTDVTEVHFHELGMLDAVADIAGVCLLMDMIGAPEVIVSPVNAGSGSVKTAHGILPVPAPATARLLTGIPFYTSAVKSELCTPTGAALIRRFAASYGEMPVMRVEKTGYGIGMKEFESANVLRAFLGYTENGTTEKTMETSDILILPNEEIYELSCNLDDMSAEGIGFAVGVLLELGALDVFTAPIYMKKNRPGVLLVCLCESARRAQLASAMLRCTSTLGVREKLCARYALARSFKKVNTAHGEFTVKYASGYGAQKYKPEYEDIARIAKEKNLPFQHIADEILREIGEK